MAQNQLGNNVDISFVNSKHVQDGDAELTNFANYGSITALKARLAAFDAFTYTAARLDQMTVNDMVYALRSIDDPTSIASYRTAQIARSS